MAKITFTKVDPSTIKTTDRFLHGTGITKELGHKEAVQGKKAEIASLTHAAKQDATNAALNVLENAARSDAAILEIKKASNIQLDKWQLAAVLGAKKHKHFCVVGAAGCGKTTAEQAILDEIIASLPEIDVAKTNIKVKDSAAKEGFKIYSLCCIGFTGRSVQQIKRALEKKFHHNCMTGHRCLGYAPVMEIRPDKENPGMMKETRVFRPSYNAANKLPYNLIIIDEASMFPVRLFNELVAACGDDVRFIFIGDINQLPPVQDISVLPFAMLTYPVFELKEIHRQARDNPIIMNAHRILQGEMPIPDNKHFIMRNLDDGSIKASSQILNNVKKLHQMKLFDPMQDALIVQANKTILGQTYLNSDLMNYFNQPKRDINGVILNRRIGIKAARGTRLLAIGDKVMQLENDNDLGLTNGMIGVIVDITINGEFRDKHFGHVTDGAIASNAFDLESLDIDEKDDDDDDAEETNEKEDKEKDKDENQRQASHVTTIKFSSTDGEIETKLQTVGQYNKIAHAYAITCHKSQGGEYPIVIIAFHTALARMLSREWLYTATTRARERVFMFYNNRALSTALNRQVIKGQTTEEKANSFIAIMDNPAKITPNLPPAMELN